MSSLLFSTRVNCEPMLWYYGVILMPLCVGIVLVLVLVLEATVLETSLILIIMSPLRRHIFVCFMAKSAFLGGFSALAPYTGVGPI